MTRDFEYMLQLFVDGAMGQKTEPDSSVSIENVIALSIEHNIYYSILNSLLMSDLISCADAKEKHEKELKNLRLAVYVKNFKLSEIFKKFEAASVPYVMLKGLGAAALYHDPYSRVSGDTDILINKEDEKQAISILVENGFVINELSAEDTKHSELYHPQLGIVELHVSLYNDETASLWLDKNDLNNEENGLCFENLSRFSLDELDFYVQKPDDNVDFLFMHNVTHFVAGGTSIKAIMDFFLAYVNSKEVDFRAFYDKIEKLNFTTIFRTMIATVERFLPLGGLEAPFYEYPGNDYVDALIEDIETGKWLGYGNDSYAAQRKQVFDEKTAQASSCKEKILKKLFPSSRYLRNNYKYAMKCPILVPVAWVHRLARYCFCNSFPKNKAEENNSNCRIDLLKKFNLL